MLQRIVSNVEQLRIIWRLRYGDLSELQGKTGEPLRPQIGSLERVTNATS